MLAQRAFDSRGNAWKEKGARRDVERQKGHDKEQSHKHPRCPFVTPRSEELIGSAPLPPCSAVLNLFLTCKPAARWLGTAQLRFRRENNGRPNSHCCRMSPWRSQAGPSRAR